MNPPPAKPGELRIEPRKLVMASAVEAVFIVAAVLAYVMTENMALLIGLILIGTTPVLWVVLSAVLRKPRSPSQTSIVEDARGLR